ncbi:leucine-rich repeat extensin-like protein 4 [Euphorbia lathyris]|uniref:leucine-rich repeat extensin-like protein 4 n=1 Tax=Euphorbia lathyris TaxID=212925 RepID=UPI0033142F56
MASFSPNPVFRLIRVLILLLFHLSYNIAADSASAHHRHRSHSLSLASNARLHRAYIALQAWKRVIYSDPRNFTSNWIGLNVCEYHGIYCTSAPHDPKVKVVAGIDLNFGDIAGFIPEEFGLLTDLALVHLNSNRFCGILPPTIANLTVLYELDISNNRFVGRFPSVVLSLPKLKFLDLRYNEFEGPTPPRLFEKQLDAIFINNNRFTSVLPAFKGRSSASVLVIANNKFGGALPPSISNFADSLEELVLINSSLTGCLPPEVGYLYKLRLLDVSNNNIVGPIPYSLAGLAHLETLNLADNMMTGNVHGGICVLPSLSNFTLSYNFFCEEDGICANLTSKGIVFDDRENCLPDKPHQRSKKECKPVIEHPVDWYEECYVHGGGHAPVPAVTPMFPPSMAPSTALLPPSMAPSTPVFPPSMAPSTA